MRLKNRKRREQRRKRVTKQYRRLPALLREYIPRPSSDSVKMVSYVREEHIAPLQAVLIMCGVRIPSRALEAPTARDFAAGYATIYSYEIPPSKSKVWSVSVFTRTETLVVAEHVGSERTQRLRVYVSALLRALEHQEDKNDR